MATSPTIASLCYSCSSQMARYLKDPYPNTERQANQLQRKLDHFVETFNVYGDALFSLDSLLRRERGLRDRVMFLLSNTADNLARAVSARELLASSLMDSTTMEDPDDSSSATTSGNTFATYRSRITSTLDPLETIERNIKRLSIVEKYINAAIPQAEIVRFMLRDPTMPEFKAFLEKIILFKFKSFNPSGFLFERLVASLLLRRARFRYLQARCKVTEGPPRLTRSTATADSAARSQDSDQFENVPTWPGLDLTIGRLVRSASPSATETSTLWEIAIGRTDRMTGMPDEEANHSLPPPGSFLPSPPLLTAGIHHATCPYCRELLPTPVIRSAKAWRRHLIADLQPFVCFQEDCERSLDTFKTMTDWEDHLITHNQEWFCHAPIHTIREITSEPGRAMTFDTKEAFERHLREEHLDASCSNLASIITANSRRPSPIVADKCLFCDMPFPVDDRQNLSVFLRHAQYHFIDLAVYSLPEPGEDGLFAFSEQDNASLHMSGSSNTLSSTSWYDWRFEDGSPTDLETRTATPEKFKKALDALGYYPRSYSHHDPMGWWLDGLPNEGSLTTSATREEDENEEDESEEDESEEDDSKHAAEAPCHAEPPVPDNRVRSLSI